MPHCRISLLKMTNMVLAALKLFNFNHSTKNKFYTTVSFVIGNICF